MKTTRFADLANGTKFILGGNDRDEWIKVDSRTARLLSSKLGAHSRIAPEREVVTETGASVADILGSWGRM